MIIVTTNEVPGYAVEAVLGEVMGMTVRSANFGANFSASFRAIGGGEVTEYTQLVYESRNEVMNRMWAEAQRRGGNAIIGMRFDTGEIGQAFTEICAYGTAVVVRPLAEGEPGATPQSMQQAGQRRPPAPQPPHGGPAPQPFGRPAGPPPGQPSAPHPAPAPGQQQAPGERPGPAPSQPGSDQTMPRPDTHGYSPQVPPPQPPH